jgi:DNA-binding winged helix-turn-helix (wHTH) protein
MQSVATTAAGRPEGFAKIRLNLMAIREVYQFREFTLDIGERRLSRREVPVHLPPKAHDLLVMLVRQPGRLLTKDELLARIWPNAFVEEGILTVHVSAVRKALGDDARPPTFIETVSGSGYRFIAPVSTVPPDAESYAARDALRPLEDVARRTRSFAFDVGVVF